MNKLLRIIFLLFTGIIVCSQLLAQQNTIIVKNINSDELNDMLGNNIQLIDVRTDDEFAEGHIKGAQQINIISNRFDSEVEKLDKDKPVILYCAVGGRSTAAMRKLKSMGFKEIYNFIGGVREWTANNFELVKE